MLLFDPGHSNTDLLPFLHLQDGFSGSAPIACGGGSIGDLFSERDRASAMAIYSLGPLIGPAVGPVAGGFIAQTIGTKYVFIVIAAACAVSLLLGVPLLQETYAPVIRLRRARAEGDLEKAKHFHGPISDMGKWEYLWLNLSRPVILLTRSFICFMLSLYMALYVRFVCAVHIMFLLTWSRMLNIACMGYTTSCSPPSLVSSFYHYLCLAQSVKSPLRIIQCDLRI